MRCQGRAKHTEQAARSVAYVKTEKGGRWVATPCAECKQWHVTERIKPMCEKREKVIFQCFHCSLPHVPPEDADRISHGLHLTCSMVAYPEQYAQSVKEKGNDL